MIVGRAAVAVTALVALASAVTVAVVAAAFALFSALVPFVGLPGAAAIVSAIFALIVALAVLIVASRKSGHHQQHNPQPGDFDLFGRIFDIARDKPIMTAGAAIAAGLLAIRNPALVATIVAAFMDRPKHRN